MAETADAAAARPWVWRVTLACAVLAPVSHVVAGTDAERLTGALAAVALAGAVYLLYRWGQHRDPPSGDGDEDSRRRKESKAEAGGYGGNGGGL